MNRMFIYLLPLLLSVLFWAIIVCGGARWWCDGRSAPPIIISGEARGLTPQFTLIHGALRLADMSKDAKNLGDLLTKSKSRSVGRVVGMACRLDFAHIFEGWYKLELSRTGIRK